MRITIIGGTKFIGLHTATHLAALGHRVTVAHRGQTPATIPGVEHLTLDQTHPDAARLLSTTEPEAILHNIVREPAHVAWLEDTIHTFRCPLVMTSSMDVYQTFGHLLGADPPPPSGSSTAEDAPLRTSRFPYRGVAAKDDSNPMWHYDKIPAEQLAIDLGNKHNIPVILPRLPMVLGPGDPQRRLARFVHSMNPTNNPRDRVVMSRTAAAWKSSYGYVPNVAALLAQALIHAKADPAFKAPGLVLHAIDAVYSARQLAQLVAAHTGWTGQILEIDNDTAPEELGMPAERAANLCFTQLRTDELLGDYRVKDPHAAIAQAIEHELTQPPPEDLPKTHAAEDSVTV